VWWRTLLTIWRAKALLRRRGPIAPHSVGRVRLTTLPTDIDLLMHMNNGRYASLFDLGRFDLLIRTGIWDAMNARDWYAVVASETVTFRKSLQLWQRFTVESASYAHDDKAVYQIHRGRRGEVYAEMIVRARFLRRAAASSTPTSSSRRSAAPTTPSAARVDQRLGCGLRSPSTKAPAPSVWE
jgi:acyl-CoA thioesterase FadM